uniref:BTB domain-containing protein n=1 Tax=Proboscia inermis TaxID=420281 RepID=A0A7S0C5M4_9STRA
MVLVNIPAVILASKGISVLTLFLVADLVCATATLPVFLGLITKDIGPIPAPTELGAFLGVWSGIGTVLYMDKIGQATMNASDVTLISQSGHEFFTHRYLICAHSDYFR